MRSNYMKSSFRALSLLDNESLTFSHIKQIQSNLTVCGAIVDPYAAGKILSFCAISSSGNLTHASNLFQCIPHRTTYMWNTMIRAFAERRQPMQALSLYKEMLGCGGGFSPNNFTFSFILRACGDVLSLGLGLGLHSHVVKWGWEGYDFVVNGLVHLYVCCGCVEYARKLFDECSSRDVITWTSLINGYVKSEQIGLAREVFDEMPLRNAVSWSAMINGYVQVGMFKGALELFNEMQISGCRPNHAGVVGALTACAFLGALYQGRWIHSYIDKNKMDVDNVLGTALVDMYAKCGSIDTARHVFECLSVKDVFAYTSLISGLANHNQTAEAMTLYVRMQNEGVLPNEVTFICVLNACSRMGSVEEGLKIFDSMKRVYAIEPAVEHYGCLVDLLGRAGMLEQAKRVVKEMPMKPDSYVLGALLNGCRVRGDVELGTEMVDYLAAQNLDHGGVHVLLSNMLATENKWDSVARVRKGMEERKVKKVPGCSVIEMNGSVCEFVAGDQSHGVLMEDARLLLPGIVNNLKFDWQTKDCDEMIFEIS
uniref:Pentatricopeptide repeat-containing protein n=1 Tax=Kalanchoe fedtschenkoi TaxID=63787 RepID=A0A7N0RIP0_KALFE